jgi:hypothetical protein
MHFSAPAPVTSADSRGPGQSTREDYFGLVIIRAASCIRVR